MPPAVFEPAVSAGERQQTPRFAGRGHWDREANNIKFINKP